MKTGKGRKQNKILQYMLIPIRILIKARDFYMKGMEDCAGRAAYAGGLSIPGALPKSFSVNSSKSSDNSELLRVSSRRNRQAAAAAEGGNGMGMRSYSVGVGRIGRIDEDAPCSFEEDGFFPRSRSYAVRRNVRYY